MRAIDGDTLFREMEKAQWYNNADRDEVAEELVLNAPIIEIDSDTVSRQAVRMCLTGDVTDMSIEQYIKMVDKRLEQLPPSPSRPHDISKAKFSCPICGAEMEVTVDEWDEGGER